MPSADRLPLAAIYLLGIAIGACLFGNAAIALAATGAAAIVGAILLVRTLNREKRS